jgi:hypothetical protein
LTAVLAAGLAAAPSALSQAPAKPEEKKTEPRPMVLTKDGLRDPTAEQVAEMAILVFGMGGGRVTLNQIRKTAIERGKIKVLNGSGSMDSASYQRWISRGADGTGKERVRLDQQFPAAAFSLVYSDERIFGIFNDSVFTPREDASRAFENQIVHGLDALLRYKENESRLELAGSEKIMGVDHHLLDVIDKQERRTRFYVRTKTFRVNQLEYNDEGVKYRRKFYDYNVAQGTLVPFRSVLYAGDRIVEETDIGTVTFGQKVDDSMFTAG